MSKPLDFKSIALDYIPNADDDDLLLELKTAIQTELTEPERRIFLAYLELGSYAAVAREFGVCSVTAKKYIKQIIYKLK